MVLNSLIYYSTIKILRITIMNNQQDAFFFEIQQIPDNSLIFEELKKQKLFFSYFQTDQNYYLFFDGQESIDIDRIEPLISIFNELDTKEGKLRSWRGFFLYALEIMNNGKDLQILTTNLKTILRQNKKEVLLRFLFGRGYSYQGSISNSDTIEMIQNLQNQVNSLQQKVNNLEIQLKNSEYALRSQNKAPDDTKISQLGNS